MRGEVTVQESAEISDVRRDGMVVETGVPLQLYSIHDFRIILGRRSVVVKGRVVQASISQIRPTAVTYRSAVEFVGLSSHAAAALADIAVVDRPRSA